MPRLKVHESRAKDQNYDVYEDVDRVKEFRVDGFYNLMFGPTDAKLSFYSAVGLESPDDRSNGQNIEIRDVNIKLSFSVRVLLETCLNILNNVKTNQERLSLLRKAEDEKINNVLNNIQQLVDKKHQH